MHIDVHYDRTKHGRFAAYQTGYTTDQYNTDYENWLNSKPGQLTQQGLQENTDYVKGRASADDAYRNAALAQQGSSSRLAASTSRQNAQLAASTQLKTQKMQIDAQYRTFRERLNELEIPTLNLDIWKQQQDIALAKANLALAARGPRNALQYSTAMGQLGSGPAMPASLAAIARNQPAYAFEGQSGKPEALTYDDLARQYGIGGGSPDAAGGGANPADADRENAVMKAIQMVADRGPQGQAPGSLESLTSYDRDILASGLEKLGYSADDFFQRYQRAGIGQSDPRLA